MENNESVSFLKNKTPEELYKQGLSLLKKEERIWPSGEISFPPKRGAFPGEEEYAEGMACLEHAAEQGYLKAQMALGGFYWAGVEVCLKGTSAHIRKRNEEKGAYWYKAAAGQGDKSAALRLGDYFRDRWDASEQDADMEEAVSWYLKGGGYNEAANILATTGSMDDYTRAIELYKKSFESGEADIADFLDSNEFDYLREGRYYEMELDRYSNGTDTNRELSEAEMADLRNNAVKCYECVLLQCELIVDEIKRKIERLTQTGH